MKDRKRHIQTHRLIIYEDQETKRESQHLEGIQVVIDEQYFVGEAAGDAQLEQALALRPVRHCLNVVACLRDER